MAPSPSNKNSKPQTTKKSVTPTPKPPAEKKKKKSLLPLLAFGGCFVLGILACMCLYCLFGSGGGGGGGGGGGTLNVFGAGIGEPKAPSEMPATLLSGSSMSLALCFVSAIATVVLTKQKRDVDAERRELNAQMMEATRKAVLAETNMKKRFDAATKANKWIENPWQVPVYLKVPMFVLLGKVLAEFSGTDCLSKAFEECNRNGMATHVQYRPESQQAAVKTLLELPSELGNLTGNVDAMTHKCGEGYHPKFETHVHPRLFLLNEIARLGRTDFKDLSPADLLETQATSQKEKNQKNDACLLGRSSSCVTKSTLNSLFIILDILTTVFFFALTPLTGGLSLIPASIVKSLTSVSTVGGRLASLAGRGLGQVGMAAVEFAPVSGVQIALGVKEKKEAESLAARFEGLKNRAALSNVYIGGRDSYISIFQRLSLNTCSFKVAQEFGWIPDQDLRECMATKKSETGDYWPAKCTEKTTMGGKTRLEYYAPRKWALLQRLKRYEGLPVAFWNCDETTEIYQIYQQFAKNTSKIHRKLEVDITDCERDDAAFK